MSATSTKSTQTKKAVKFTDDVVPDEVPSKEAPAEEAPAKEVPVDQGTYFRDLIQSLNIKASTQLSYTRSFNILIKDLELDVENDTQKKIIEAIQTSKYAPSTQAKLLSLAVLYRKKRGLCTAGVLVERKKIECNRRYVAPDHPLPSMKELIDHCDAHYANENWVGYVVTNLLLTLCCRNLDLDCLLSDDRDMAQNGNAIYLDKKKERLVIIRRSYKTVGTYGVKRTVLKSKKLYHAVQQIIGKGHARHLLSTLSGQRVTAVGAAIQRYTYKGYGETVYCKSQVSNITQVKDLHKLVSLSKSRGTQVTTLLDYYSELVSKPLFNRN